MSLLCLCQDFMTLPTLLWLEDLHAYLFFRSLFPCKLQTWSGTLTLAILLFVHLCLILCISIWVSQGNNGTLRKAASLSRPIAVYYLSSIPPFLSFLSNLFFCSGLHLFKPRRNLATDTQSIGAQRSGAPSVGERSCGARSPRAWSRWAPTGGA